MFIWESCGLFAAHWIHFSHCCYSSLQVAEKNHTCTLHTLGSKLIEQGPLCVLQVKTLFQGLDSSGDGAINLEEFSKLVKSDKLALLVSQETSCVYRFFLQPTNGTK